MAAAPKRRGWREQLGDGIYREHGVACPSSDDRKPGRRCTCPFGFKVRGKRPGTTTDVRFRGTLAEAKRERARLRLAQHDTPRDAEPGGRRGDVLLVDHAADYLRTRSAVLSAASIRIMETDLRLRIIPALGSRRLDALDRRTVEGFVADLVRQAQTHSMLRRTVATLRSVLAAAVDWGMIPENPARRLKLPAVDWHEPQAAERVLTAGQVGELLAAARTPRIEAMLRVLVECGLRRGELIGLRWSDVDLDGRKLNVRRTIIQTAEGKKDGPPKGRRNRTVPITPRLAEQLGGLFDDATRGGGESDGIVFPGTDGDYMDARTPGYLLERAIERGGLLGEDGKPLKLSPHALRHTAASLLLGAGVPLIAVSRFLGHANPQITATVYAHLIDDGTLESAAVAMAAALA